MTIFFKKDSCAIAEIAKEPIDKCSLTGSLRYDLYSDNYILDLKNGSTIYIHKNTVSALSTFSD